MLAAHTTLASVTRYTAHALRMYSPPREVPRGLQLLADLAGSADSDKSAKRAMQTMNDATAQIGMAASSTLQKAFGKPPEIPGYEVLLGLEA